MDLSILKRYSQKAYSRENTVPRVIVSQLDVKEAGLYCNVISRGRYLVSANWYECLTSAELEGSDNDLA
ncbi:hypothetical protein Tco_0065258 [Tanacetum coccineum]